MLDIFVVLALGALWLLRWARKRGAFSSLLGGSQLASAASDSEQIDADLTDEGVTYPDRAPASLGVLYTRQDCGGGCSQLAAFLLHCCRAGVRKVVIHGHGGSAAGELRAALEAVLIDYGRDSIVIENHTGFANSEKERKDEVGLSTTRVIIMPEGSGRRTVVEAARELCHSEQPVTTAAVAAVMRRSMLDDLQAIVMVGGAPTLAAFPPWPLRIAELLPVATLPRAKADFARALSAFGARDIRAGK